MVYNPESKRLRCVSCYGIDSSVVMNQEINLGEGIAGWVAKHRMSLLLPKDLPEYDFINVTEKDRKITSAICVPLELNWQIKGVLNVNIINRKDVKLNGHDFMIAKIFSQAAVVAIERSRLFERIGEFGEETVVLPRISETVNPQVVFPAEQG